MYISCLFSFSLFIPRIFSLCVFWTHIKFISIIIIDAIVHFNFNFQFLINRIYKRLILYFLPYSWTLINLLVSSSNILTDHDGCHTQTLWAWLYIAYRVGDFYFLFFCLFLGWLWSAVQCWMTVMRAEILSFSMN